MSSMNEKMWEQLFDELTLDPHNQAPIPVRHLERVDTIKSDTNAVPTLQRGPSLSLSRVRSERSLRSNNGQVRSFHRPFYAEATTAQHSSRLHSSTISATTSDRTPDLLSLPPIDTSPVMSSFSSYSRIAPMSSSGSSVLTEESLTTPDDLSVDYDGHVHPDEHDLQDGKQNFHVVSPEDWLTCFYAQTPPQANSLNTDNTDHCPDRATLAAVADLALFDSTGRSIPFGDLYDPTRATPESVMQPRQLFIFIRHFHCGACQAYLRTMTSRIKLSEYFSIPKPTSFIVIGCGRPSMIRYYRRVTNCPWPIYADPSRRLFRRLGMSPTIDMGTGRPRPDYLAGSTTAGIWAKSMKQVAKEYCDRSGGELSGFDCVKGGNLFQIGGEFLFEAGQVVWCHRMKHWAGHAEISTLRRLLELD